MKIKEHNDREIEILKSFPKSAIPDIIEKKGQKLRELLSGDDELTDTEIIEILTEWYRGF